MLGTSGDDSIVGTTGGDSLGGLGGADTLDGGGGPDTLVGGDGDDLLIQTGHTASFQVADGGAGVDVLRIQSSEFNFGTPDHIGSTVDLNLETLTSIEKLQFGSTPNQDLFAVMTYDQVGTGLAANATLIGGQGTDTLNIVVGVAGTYTLPAFSFENWGSDDGVKFQGADSRAYLLQATAAHPGVVSLVAGAGDDTLVGGAGQEYLDGVYGSNSLDGGGGADTLVSSEAADTLRGGDGDDLLVHYGSTSSYEVLDGGAGVDTLRTSSDAPNGGVYGAPVHYEALGSGLSSIERLEFASHANQSLQVILSFDQVQALAPALTLVGGQGADVLTVAVGDAPGVYALPAFQLASWEAQDTIELLGGAGASTLSGGAGDVYLQGGAGAESLSAGGGHDTLYGGDGNDSIALGAGSNEVNGNKGDDLIVGRSLSGDQLSGGQGNDLIDVTGSSGHNVVNGNIGDDTVRGGSGGDSLYGGQGDDSIVGGAGVNEVNGNIGQDTIVGRSTVGDELSGGQGNDLLDATASSGHNWLNGNLGADVVRGGSGGDSLRGGQGDDRVVGGSGADWLSGDMGHDTLTGGQGADTFHVAANNSQTIVTDFNFAEGDRVQLDHGATYTVAGSGADTVITLDSGAQVVLQNVNATTLPAGAILIA